MTSFATSVVISRATKKEMVTFCPMFDIRLIFRYFSLLGSFVTFWYFFCVFGYDVHFLASKSMHTRK